MNLDWWKFDHAKIVRIIDGDTVILSLQLGFTVSVEVTVRLYGINAPESKGATKAAGLASANQLRQLLPCGCDVRIETLKIKEKYGRYLARIWRADAPAEACVNDLMIRDGFAIAATY